MGKDSGPTFEFNKGPILPKTPTGPETPVTGNTTPLDVPHYETSEVVTGAKPLEPKTPTGPETPLTGVNKPLVPEETSDQPEIPTAPNSPVIKFNPDYKPKK